MNAIVILSILTGLTTGQRPPRAPGPRPPPPPPPPQSTGSPSQFSSGLPITTGQVPTNPQSILTNQQASTQLVTQSRNSEKIITAWKQSTGKGYNNIQADVLGIYYDANYVYISTNSIPSYTIGPTWTANPNLPAALGKTFQFPRYPKIQTGTKSKIGLGVVGLWINGLAIFNADDGRSYNNAGVWNRNAEFWEGISFDKCLGHAAPGGVYHNHVNLNCYYDPNDSSKHSPLLGYLFDGYPIYGTFGYSSANSSSSTPKRISTSYQLRKITDRTKLPNNVQLSSSQYGPAISSQYPLGAFLQDYEYVPGSGDLDEYNGRWCVTPEYPEGTYAYFVTTDSAGKPAFPFTAGPSNYFGQILNRQGFGTTVPSTATTYFKV